MEMKIIPSSKVMQKAPIFFLKNSSPFSERSSCIYAYLYQKIPYKLSIYLVEQEGQCLDDRYDQRATGLLLLGRKVCQGKGLVGDDVTFELEGLQALDCTGINC